MSDKPPPPSAEHFRDFTRRLLAVPKEKVDALVAAEKARKARRRTKSAHDPPDVVG